MKDFWDPIRDEALPCVESDQIRVRIRVRVRIGVRLG